MLNLWYDPGIIRKWELMINMSFQFETLDNIRRGDSETLLLYGGAGTGKTFFTGTAGPRTLFINIGNGISTIQSPFFRSKYPSAGQMLVVTLVEDFDKNGAVRSAKLWDSVTEVIENALVEIPDKFDTIVIDDATALRRAAMTTENYGSSTSLANNSAMASRLRITCMAAPSTMISAARGRVL